ncbi:MAG: HD domain-containing protein [Eubacterium sp.]|nr:HD domain-containing protein [Eubacterium sp.]
MDYSEVIEFVKQTASENSGADKTTFRNSYDHTMRVYRWAIRLQAKLGGDLDVIVLAALLHDVGCEQAKATNQPPNEVSAEIAVEYLDSIGVDPELIVKVGEIIMICPDKETDKDLSIECKIVMDSDFLDEIGAVGIMRDCMITAGMDDASYKRAYYRIKDCYRKYKPLIRCCKTETARTEFTKRMQLIESYIYQLEKEIF